MKTIVKLTTMFAIVIASLVGVSTEASAVTVAQVTGLKAEAPYVHRDIIGRKWIYAASQTNSTASYPLQSELYQYYGGRWNKVGTTGSASGSYARAVGFVLCGGAMTNYSFFTRAWVKYNGSWYYLDSRVVTQSC